ncbi:amino acid adenylation domain-containing protein [Pseudomonas sp. SWI7]|nr:non-ribosomal peptide synthase/polyketide synthase [Pseudomonas sp. SWI7]QDC03898.1 amino acid adenylation domain-containing protein [Pseudomonas sp. SWI7]
MDHASALRIAQRFIALPVDKRRQYLAKMAEQKVSPGNLPIPVIREQLDSLPLSFAQERQWFLWQLEPGSSASHIPTALRLRGHLDTQALQQAFDALVARHETLRTTFVVEEERPCQRVHGALPIAIEPLHLPATLAPEHQDAQVQALIEQQIARPFDLEHGPLVRLGLLTVADEEHVLVMVQHHIVSDGWSMQVMVDELMQLYLGFVHGRAVELPALPIQYADYAIWQRRWMEAGGSEQQLAYWREQLGAHQPVLELPTDRPRAAQPSLRGARVDLPIDSALSEALQGLAQQQQVTLFMLLLASFQVLLHRYTGQTDIRVGVPNANRNRVETDRLLGFFVNTQVLRADVQGALAFPALLQQVKQTVLGAQAHQDLPFEQLVEALQPDRSLSHNPLFQVMYNHQRQGRDQRTRQVPGLDIEGLFWESHSASFDLTLDTVEGEDGLWASLTYACDLFDAATIERLGRHWLTLLRSLVADPSRCIAALPMLAVDEHEHLHAVRNAPDLRHADGPLVHERIAQWAAQTPQATALLFGEQRMSFAQLDQQANRLAHALVTAGVGPEVLVGIALERGLEMVVSLLAVLKAGGAYTPLDPQYPRERLAYLMQDSGMALLLSDSALMQRLPVPEGLATLALDHMDLAAQPCHAPANAAQADNLAYVIYTSGSTGLPKGVAVAHGPIAMHCRAIGERYEMTPADCELHFMSFAFDGAHERWLTPLTHGASLLIRDPQLWTPEQTYAAMHEHGVTVAAFPPVYLQQLAEHAERDGNPPPMRVYCFGGDAVSEASYAMARRALRPTYIINGYGPTETVVTPLIWKAGEQDRCGAAYAPIGDRVGERRAYVLDADLNLLPLAIPGELYLGGQGLARGYLKRPALTAERFVPDPFGNGARLYRSGDRVSLRSSGIIDYLGRIDRQVKVRGFRIELGEVEARLLAVPGVREAVVVAQAGPSGQQLVGYVVSDDAPQLASDHQAQAERRESIKRRLKVDLPDYMVPTHVQLLERMPLTPNGKIDRQALPAVDLTQLQGQHVAASSPLEQALVQIWQAVLKVPQVGVTDNFFELGGDSIISIQVVSRARQAGIVLSPKDLFLHQTVQALAGVARFGEVARIDQGPVAGSLPLLAIQRWFFAQGIADAHHWNQSVLLAPTQALQPRVLEAALQALVLHHDALRLHFDAQAGLAWHRAAAQQQGAEEQAPLLWHATVARGQALTALCEQAQRSLDLHQGPLLRAVLAELDDGSQRLLLVVHHLVVDGVSWRILFDDLQQAYSQCLAGQALSLPAKTTAYKQWAERLQALAQTPALAEQLPYWQAQVEGAVDDLPGARPHASLEKRHACTVHTRLDDTLTRQLLQQAPAAYRTQVNDLLLTALTRVICRWTGQASALIQLEGHGREDLFDDVDLTRTVGWFTSAFPVRLDSAGDVTDTIKTVKQQLRAIPDKGIGYGALRYMGSAQSQAALNGLAEPRITFNYLGQFDGSFASDQGALFVPASEDAGAEQGAEAPLGNWLSINGQVYAGQLRLGWTFSEAMFERTDIERLAQDYARELNQLVAHCLLPDSAGVTPSDFPLAMLDPSQLDALGLPWADVQDLYPLSPMQQGMLFHSLLEQQGGDYINQLSVSVQGLAPERFREAWQAVVQRHDILRSGLLWQGGLAQPLQWVRKQVQLPCREIDLRGHADLDAALTRLADAEREQGFDLAQAPLLRLTLARTGDDRYQLIYTSHHILLDGWSNSQLLGEVLQHYAGQAVHSLNGRYSDYIGWLQRQDKRVSEAFWRTQFATLDEPTWLSRALKCAATGQSGQGEFKWRLDAAMTEQLHGFARQQKVTLNTLVQAAWLLLLQRYTGHDSVTFGATVAGRPTQLQGIEQQIGLFINTLPVVARPEPQQALAGWLQTVQGINLALRDHEHSALSDVQRWAGQGGDGLFDTLLVFENYPVSEALQQGGVSDLHFGDVHSHEQNNYPLTLSVSTGADLLLHYSYDAAQFSAECIAQVASQLAHLLAQMADGSPQRCLGELKLFEEGRLRAPVQDWGMAAGEYPSLAPAHVLFEQQARRVPNHTALITETTELTYAQLNAAANRLAHRLIAQGVGPDVLVGIAAERDAPMVVALLAVLKAGGGYVPLDPKFPQERLQQMVEDSRVALLLTQSHLRETLALDAQVQCLLLDTPDDGNGSDSDPLNRVHADNLAYVIFTSGSTGRPKGVAISHGALTRHAFVAQWYSDIHASDCVLQFATFNFDAFVEQLYAPLVCGATVMLRGNEIWDSETFYQRVLAHGISVADLPTAYWNLLATQFASVGPRDYGQLRQIHAGGEAMPPEGMAAWLKAGLGHVRLLNTYGPTETTVTSTTLDCTPYVLGEQPVPHTLPIGTALPGREIYLLDDAGQPVPTGVVGELVIGGELLARGYFGRSALTAERFLPDPFAGNGGRLYRTGDLARYRADGVIDYVGRVDHQVKIRGFRIELGEIETCLLAQVGVSEALVVAQPGPNGPQLVAYLVADADVQALREALKASLPDYMVPAHVMLLDHMPLSPSGKIDRKALPLPEASSNQAFIAPQTPLEQQLARIWQDVLKLERVGVDDNFFELGGDSIISIQVVSRARQQGLHFTPKELFQHQTLRALAKVVRNADSAVQIDQGTVLGGMPLLPVQHSFFSEVIAQRHHWNQSVLLVPRTALQGVALEQALQALVQHHDALRLTFSEGEQGWLAEHGEPVMALLWQRQVADAQALTALCDDAQRSLDLAEGPLLRAVLATLADGSQRLLLVIHHLVVDGVSWRILFEDLQQAYAQCLAGQPVKLPSKTTAYKAWAQKLEAHAHSPALQGQKDYWMAQLRGQRADLPGVKVDAGMQGHHAQTVQTRLDAQQTRRLLQQAPAAYRTQVNDLLLTALARVICQWTGEQAALIQLEGHGREELFDDVDLTRTVGWFTSVFPVKLPVSSDLGDTLRQVKEHLRGIPDKGVGYGVLRYLGDAATREALAALATPRITFNYLGQFDGSFAGDDDALFTPATEKRGREQSPDAPLDNWLVLNGRVYDGCLSLDWTFSREQFDVQAIEALADAYGAQLQALIEHCLAPDAGGVTPSDFPLAGLDQAQLDQLAVSAANLEDIYPLSPMQQGMLFHSLYEQGSGDYLNQMRLDIGGLDPQRFRSAWQATLDAHAILRTGFNWQFEQAVQMVLSRVELPFRLLDLRDDPAAKATLDAVAQSELQQGFELHTAPLLRLVLAQTNAQDYHLIYTSHHILMDGWSTSQLLGEVLQRYAGQPVTHGPTQYRDYIGWLLRQDRQASEVFWRDQLACLPAPTLLAQALKPATRSTGQRDHFHRLDEHHTQRLNAFARRHKVTLNTVIQAAWLLLLQRYTGHNGVVFGATVAGRPAAISGVEQQIGLFINTLPVVSSPQAEQPLQAWLHALVELNLALREQEHTPLFDIQRWAGQGGEALFDNILVFENYPVSEALQAAPVDLRFGSIDNHEQSNYPLTVSVNAGSTVLLHFTYAGEAFDAPGIASIGDNLAHLLLQMVEGADGLCLGDLTLLDDGRQRAPVQDWGMAAGEYPSLAPAHVLFEQQARRVPNHTALITETTELTYAQLNAAANRLAHRLIAQGVGPDVLVGIAVERDAPMVVALLAVLKAGGGYVPLDPKFPQERLQQMVEDSRVALLLTQSHLRETLALDAQVQCLLLDTPDDGNGSGSDPLNRVHADNLAYVIFTSGSTGRPKGVAISHGALTRHAFVAQWYSDIHASDCVLQFATFNFDAFVEQLYAPLVCGATVMLRGNEIWDSETFYQRVLAHGISVADLPTAYWNLLATQFASVGPRDYGQLRQIHAGGEAMPPEGMAAWLKAGLGHVRLLNTYGPTETTVTSTTLDCTPYVLGEQPVPHTLPIGTALPGREIYLLDDAGQPVPTGVVGELVIGGELLARGYFGRSALTAERFLPDPFAGNGGRLYRTGDLARYRADGVIDYVGRVDHQVKIRGFRIELGEIETCLLAQAGVSEALVMAQPGPSGPQLVGYVVTQVDVATLREALKASLPDYMVPAHLMVLDGLPLSPSGKIDRKALPQPEAASSHAFVAPQTALEQQLATVWQDVLKLERVGVDDNFFELGGDSIISIQVVSRARQLGLHLTPKALFQHQTLRALAQVVGTAGTALQIDQGAVTGTTPLLPVQHSFFSEAIAQRHHWNQSVLLVPSAPLHGAALEQALQALVHHHDALRLRFSEGDQGWQACHGDNAQPLLWQREVTDVQALTALCDDAQRSLDLAEGPLLRAVLATLADGSQRLLLVIHHLVVDGVSWRILFEDLQQAYQQCLTGQPLSLPAKTSAYKAWAERLQAHAQSETLRQQLGYWQAQLQGFAQTLPGEDAQGSQQVGDAQTVQVELDAALTRQLLQQAPAAYRTQVNDLLLTALARVICHWTGEHAALIELEGHGREALFDDVDLTRTVGWFTSLFPVRLPVAGPVGDTIKQVKEHLRAIPDKGIGFGVLRYLGDAATRQALTGLSQPRITFNYLGQFSASAAGEDDALFAPAAESGGRQVSDQAPLGNALTINGQVFEGALKLDFTFSRQRFAAGIIEHLAHAYVSELRTVVEHCLALEHLCLTPSDFPLAGLSQAQLDRLPVPAEAVEDLYPLSPMQQGILFHTLEAAQQGLYVSQTSVQVQGLDNARFLAAWQHMVDRHEILRTGFWTESHLNEPLQWVAKRAELRVRELDWRGRPVSAADLQGLAEQDYARGFDLLQPPLMGLTLVRLDEGRQQLIWSSHHILMDGWSHSRLLGEVFAVYGGQALPGKHGSYRDYIAWLAAQPQAQMEHFWKDKLAGLEGPTLLATGLHPAPVAEADGYDALYLNWDAAQTRQLRDQAQRLRVTPNTLIQAAWLLLLQRYTGQARVCFGATVAGRPANLPGAEDMLGLFINTLPIIQAPLPEQPVGQWLQALQDYNVQVRDYEHVSLADVQRWSGQSGQALFDSIVVFENYPLDERLQDAGEDGLRFGASEGRDVTNYAMDLAVHLDDTLSIEFLYWRSRFSHAACQGIRRSFERLLQALLGDPLAAIGSLPMLDADAERQQAEANRLVANPTRTPLLQRIAGHVQARGQQVAVSCAGQSLTYAELEARANRLAVALIDAGAAPEVRVGVALERSVDMIVAFYAVLKTGAAYVPVDIDYPRERVQWIIEDSAMRLLISQASVSERLPSAEGVDTLLLESLAPVQAQVALPAVVIDEDNLAYLIYTSGSLGKPKGVAVARGPLAMHCQAIIERYGMSEATRELLFMSFAFDGAQERWLSTLAAGGQLVVRDNRLWTPEETWQVLHEQAITIACFPPAYLQQLAEYGQAFDNPPPVQIYCFGGDAVADANFELVKRTLRPRLLTNGYGPTETVVTPLLWVVDTDQRCEAAYAPIGTRVGERTLHILDACLNPLPDGVPGELYIGGQGLARGYHARPGLTAERFVADPSGKGARLYRTGDLVRRRADGVIDFLGRLDHQVKIRGFRIELGEIEARLRSQPQVRDAVVVARDTEGGKQLIGYVATSSPALQGEALRMALQQGLPDYMVPSQILVLEHLPLSPNGKVDRKALPDPSFKGREYVAPRNALEAGLAAIWQEVLELEQVGVTDNFFELGGDSLRTLKVLSKVRNQPALGVELKLRDMMSKPTIAELSGYVDDAVAVLSPLLPLNGPVAQCEPLFCLHAGFGTVFDYEPLARRLDGVRQVIGVQCRMLLDKHWQDSSLEAMAQDYAGFIREQQPQGPYHLLGWSLGGPLALLVARVLEGQGQCVHFVGLVDSFVPGDHGPEDDLTEELRNFLSIILDQPPESLPAFDLSDDGSHPALEALVAQVQAHVLVSGDSPRFAAEELVHAFTVALRLKALSRRLASLPAIECPASFWWAEDGYGAPAQAYQRRFSQDDATLIHASHFEILKQPQLLREVCECLDTTTETQGRA